jgi:hypothetical protein
MVERFALLGLAAVVAIGGGCTGKIEGQVSGGPGDPMTTPTGPAPGLIDDGRAPAAQPCTPGNPPPTTRFVRLTHAQYDSSIRALTGVALQPSLEFPVDQNQAGFDRGVDLQVGDALGKAYRASAESLAAQIVAMPTVLRKVVGCDPALADACARTFIGDAGRRLFRRPLAEPDVTKYLALFAKGTELVDGAASAFDKGVQVVLQAFLQSPRFLYRAELGTQASGGLIALDGFELASRLAFTLTNGPPDDALLDAAVAGKLATVDDVAAQARRLLGTPAARGTVADFHRQWMELDALDNKLAKDRAQYPTVTPELAPVLRAETERFVEAVTFEDGKGLKSLLTAPFAFVNATTAPLYGLDGGKLGGSLTRVQLDPRQRAGLLTQVAFLAGHAYSDKTSPIHRGVFIQRRVLCNTIPEPPANLPPPPPLGPTQTTRQQVEMHTSAPACATCHQAIINPVGFAFEGYDAVGQYRTTENGAPIDATGVLVGTQAKPRFADAVEASRLIAESPEARACYATNWTRYAFGRQEVSSDECAIDVLAAKLADDSYKVTDLLVDLTHTKAFMYRAAGGN